jgi:GNAT superfamily N-acetyltransferase
MYADYLKETQDKEMLQTEAGFITYGFNCVPGVDGPHIYIEDLFVIPSMRKTHIAATMADYVCERAKERGIHLCIGSVNKSAKTNEASCKVLEAYGMSKFSEDTTTKWYIKEIK